MVEEIYSSNFDEKIKNEKVVVDLFATWCGPCRMLSPILDEISNELTDIKFYKLDVDQNEDIARKYNVMSIPTILVFEKGILTNTLVGLRSKSELVELFK